MPNNPSWRYVESSVGEWANGAAIVFGMGLLLALLSRRVPGLWRDGFAEPVARAFRDRPLLFALALAGLAFAAYALIARLVFGGKPLLIDEIVQLLHAQIFADGALSRPAPTHPEFFGLMHWVDTEGRSYSQFPPGGPAMLLPGVLLHAPWLIVPLWGAGVVVAWEAFLRVAEPRAGIAAGATILLAAAPFMAFMAGTHMNHVPALFWCVVGMAALARTVTGAGARDRWALLCGLAFGLAASVRPFDAFAFALPAGVWLLVRALRERTRWREVAAAAAGVAIPALLLCWFNWRTTGEPLRFGYQVLWGNSVGPGFHATPWGVVHTPARGLGIINVYFLALQTSLFETPIPSLLPVIIAFALTRRMDAFDRYLLVSSALIVGVYFAYWHDGLYLGPRFFLSLMPVLTLWTARVIPLVRERFGSGLAHRTSVYGAGVAALIALAISTPIRARQHASGFVTMRWDGDSAVQREGIQDAVILVRESWGSQVVARLWGIGVSRPTAELLYGHVDTCLLDHAVASLERDGVRGKGAERALVPLLADSARVQPTQLSPDQSEHVLPGLRYSPRCASRIGDDRAGYTLLAPLLLARGGNNVVARDLHERNALLLAGYPERPVYLLRPAGAEIDSPLEFVRVPRDSLLRLAGDAARSAGGAGPAGR